MFDAATNDEGKEEEAKKRKERKDQRENKTELIIHTVPAPPSLSDHAFVAHHTPALVKCCSSPSLSPLSSSLSASSACVQHVDIAALLIKYNTCVNATDKWAFTPLHEAAQKGRTQLCALLLAHGADPTMKNQEGQTPLDLATVPARKRKTCCLAFSLISYVLNSLKNVLRFICLSKCKADVAFGRKPTKENHFK